MPNEWGHDHQGRTHSFISVLTWILTGIICIFIIQVTLLRRSRKEIHVFGQQILQSRWEVSFAPIFVWYEITL